MQAGFVSMTGMDGGMLFVIDVFLVRNFIPLVLEASTVGAAAEAAGKSSRGTARQRMGIETSVSTSCRCCSSRMSMIRAYRGG